MFRLDRVNGPSELTQRRLYGCAAHALYRGSGGGGGRFSLVVW